MTPERSAAGYTDRLAFADRLALIHAATESMVADLDVSGPDALVPTCPDWTMRDLLTHQGQVFRWAGQIVATAASTVPDLAPPPPSDDELAAWLTAGATDLTAALAAASDDLVALAFLKSAPPAKQFWARRQVHESTIHAVDALAARHERWPTAKETDIGVDVAVDGLDELLVGFLPRKSTALRAAEPFSFVVAPTDVDVAWTVRLSQDPPITRRSTEPAEPAAQDEPTAQDGPDEPTAPDEPAAVVTGTAAGLYLGLWNRGDEIAVTGDIDLLGEWREQVRIRFS